MTTLLLMLLLLLLAMFILSSHELLSLQVCWPLAPSVKFTKKLKSYTIIIIMIYHDFFPPPRRGSHVRSDTHTELSNTHPLAHILGTCVLISVVALSLQFTPHNVTASNFYPDDKPPGRERAVRKNTGTKRKWPHETQSSTYAPGLSTTSYRARIVAQLSRSSLWCPRPPSRYPSNLTSIYPIPTLH